MCRFCCVSAVSLEIPRIPSKFNKQRSLNIDPIPVNSGECVWEIIQGSVKCPYEQLAIHEFALKLIAEYHEGANLADVVSEQLPMILAVGVEEEWLEFERALAFLASHNPTRMKTIEQLELNYRKSVLTSKQQRHSALTSLQTRQSLEMDMLQQSSSSSRSELESLVHQHCSEIDGLVAFWDAEIQSVRLRQLCEYKDLVTEVVHSESAAASIVKNNRHREYRRPEVVGLEWISMKVVAVRPSLHHKTRLVRISIFQGDFISSLISPKIADSSGILDPEELCVLSNSDSVASAMVLGTSSSSFTFNSNQDIELVRRIDNESPADCRWPSLTEQVESLRQKCPSVGKTRHSNLGHGITTIYHMQPCCFSSESVWLKLFEDCEGSGINRVFIPSELVADLRAPVVHGVESQQIVEAVLKRLSNVFDNVSLDELVVVYP